jgi:hypothetical protein
MDERVQHIPEAARRQRKGSSGYRTNLVCAWLHRFFMKRLACQSAKAMVADTPAVTIGSPH